MSEAKPRCNAESVTYGTPCLRPGTVEHDGKLYCKQHARLRRNTERRLDDRHRVDIALDFVADVPTETLAALLDAGRTLAKMLEEKTP